MEEKPDGTTFILRLKSVAEEFGQQHQMIIVHPDQGSGLCCVGDCIGEQLVNSSIRLPRSIFIHYTRLVMEDWPQNSICDVCEVTALYGAGSRGQGLLENML